MTTVIERKFEKSLSALKDRIAKVTELVQECHDVLTIQPSAAED